MSDVESCAPTKDDYHYAPSMRISRPKEHGAFTLLELLIVITIIAILAALLFPALSRAKLTAKSAACQSNLRQLALMLRLYVDNEGHYPSAYGARSANWQFAIGARKVETLSGAFPPQPGRREHSAAHCPTAPDDSSMEFVRPSYGYNAFDGSPRFDPSRDPRFGRGLGGAPGGDGSRVLVPDAAVVNPSDTYALGDSFASTQTDRIVYGNGQIGRNWVLADGGTAYFAETEKAARTRHGGRLNVALCDGHVESLTIKSFLLDKDDRWKRRWHNQNISD